MDVGADGVARIVDGNSGRRFERLGGMIQQADHLGSGQVVLV